MYTNDGFPVTTNQLLFLSLKNNLHKNLIMKKKNLQSLKLNKILISKANVVAVKGGDGASAPFSNCISQCFGLFCQVHK